MPHGGGSTGGVSAQSILLWLQRNSAADQATGQYPREAWHSFLVRQLSTDGKTRELEDIWLRGRITALGGADLSGTNMDLWLRYLRAKGFTGDLADMFNNWLDHGTP